MHTVSVRVIVANNKSLVQEKCYVKICVFHD